MTTIVLIAKQPIAGRVKTRLTPPLTADEAAHIAAACIDDTIATLNQAESSRRILYFDGEEVPASASRFDVIAQPRGTLDERLAWIFDHLVEPTLLVGMDTPQLTLKHLDAVIPNWSHDVDAWFGASTDGGFWALGMREPRGDLIRGVPMSQSDTGSIQRARLSSAGLRVHELPQLTDVDTVADALSVAADVPDSRFAQALRRASDRAHAIGADLD